jgi:predicted aspartyl protease
MSGQTRPGFTRIAAAAALWLMATQAAPACTLRQAAGVALDTSTPNLIVHVAINGASVPMILDTGADRTVLDVGAVERLHLARDEWVATTMRGIGGDERQRNVLPQSMTLGGAPLRPRWVAAGLSLPVGHMAFGSAGGEPIAGLLGADLLAGYDLALDGPARLLTLYDVAGCAGRFLPWRGPYEAIPTLAPVRNVLLVPVRIDGRVLLGQIDTGAASTLVLQPGMQKLSLTEAMLDDDQRIVTRGFGPGALIVHRHRFASMVVGAETTTGPELWVAPAHALRIVDLLIGADWLRSRVVWLSYATTQVFVARR